MKHAHARTGSELTAGERIADLAVRWMGSWSFIIGQTVIVAVWIILNIASVALRWDPYPFILLNLAFSTQAAYAAPLILLAQRRADAKANERGEADLAADLEALNLLRQIAAVVLPPEPTDAPGNG